MGNFDEHTWGISVSAVSPARRHYYDPLRLPLGRRPFPGVRPVIDRHAPDPRRVGAEEGLSSSLDNRLTVPRPLRRRVPRHPLQVPGRLPWPSPNPHRLGTLSFPPHGRSLDDAADFASCCGPASCSAPLRPRPLNRTRRLHYRGPWRLPGPDSHRLAIESLRSLRHDSSFALMAPATCWTHVDRGLRDRVSADASRVSAARSHRDGS